jgi:hypothetical protein
VRVGYRAGVRRSAIALHFAVVCAACLGALPARAAELRWSAPDDCASRGAAQEQIERLVGRPLTEVDGVDFVASIERASAHEYRVTLHTILRDDGKPRTRVLIGSSCAEVADAAAVAIAIAIEGRDDIEPEPAPGPPQRAAPVVAQPAAPNPSAQPAPVAPGASTADAAPRSDAVRLALTGGAALDDGALPGLALGAELELSLGWRELRVTALGAFFPSQRTYLSASGGRGGEFQLALGGLLACGERAFGRFAALGCGGFELGELSAKGLGVRHPQLGDAFWRALRAEAGVRVALVDGLGAVARLGVAVPLERREFVLDATETVHRPSSVALRALLGLELAL